MNYFWDGNNSIHAAGVARLQAGLRMLNRSTARILASPATRFYSTARILENPATRFYSTARILANPATWFCSMARILANPATRFYSTARILANPAANFCNRPHKIFLLVVASQLIGMLTPACLTADTIWIKGQTQPRYGIVVSQNDETVVFQPFIASLKNSSTPTQKPKPVTVKRDQIDALVVCINAERLGQLDPNQPESYRDYAEELTSQKSDPVARELAIRLYVIAAAESSDDLRESSIRGLLGLAEGEQQTRKWQSLQQLTAFTPTEPQPPAPKMPLNVSDAQRELALTIVRLIRRGKGVEANRLLGQPAGISAIEPYASDASIDQLKRTAMLNRITAAQLSQILEIEVSIIERAPTQTTSSKATEDWSDFSQRPSQVSRAIPSFKNVTQIDPSLNIYRNGKWVRAGE